MKIALITIICLVLLLNIFPSFFARLAAPGYSWCGRCKFPWKFVKSHRTDYSPSRGVFPLCEKCWEELATPEARLPYYKELYDSWEKDPNCWDEIKNAVMNDR